MKQLEDMVMKVFCGCDDHSCLVAFLAWVQDEGGLPALTERCQDRGAGELLLTLASATDATMTTVHVRQLFSQAEVTALAQRMRMSSPDTTDWIRQYLPPLLRQLLPAAPGLSGSDMLSRALGLLRNQLFP